MKVHPSRRRRQARIACHLIPVVFAFVCSACLQKTTVPSPVYWTSFPAVKYLIRWIDTTRSVHPRSATRTIPPALYDAFPLTSPRNYESRPFVFLIRKHTHVCRASFAICLAVSLGHKPLSACTTVVMVTKMCDLSCKGYVRKISVLVFFFCFLTNCKRQVKIKKKKWRWTCVIVIWYSKILKFKYSTMFLRIVIPMNSRINFHYVLIRAFYTFILLCIKIILLSFRKKIAIAIYRD